MDRRHFLTVGAVLVSGCSGLAGDNSDDIQDSDGDGVIDSEDYAPNDPDVQEKSDLQGRSTATQSPTPTPQPTPTATPWPIATRTETPTPTEAPTIEFKDSDDDGTADIFDDYPNDQDYDTEHASDTGSEHVVSDEYIWWEWTQEEEVTLSWEVSVNSGSAVDAITMDESEFSKFENGEEFSYYTYGTDLRTKGSEKTITLSPGSYRFVLSNLNVGTDESSSIEYSYLRAN